MTVTGGSYILNSNRPIEIGFIGGGINSAIGETHRIASQMDGCFRLVAGAFSTSKAVNLQTASAWGVDKKRVYHKWNELLENERNNISTLAVLTPTPSHYQIVMQAL